MANQKSKKITIMGLLAECSTDQARNLLKKYGMPPAKNKAELELALANLYKTADDKKQLEKDFAEIHPHKNFMKKYLAPNMPQKKEIKVEEIKVVETKAEPTKEIIATEIKSNANGNCSCGCSNFSGADQLKKSENSNNNDKDKLIVYGMFGIVSILALVLISQQIKK
jgi:hypothetical protein